ncbi:uncharacterized protein LOC122296957 [Carya illinoinensis]|uniref:uncharacterized protein LOC122296957 n=1 Tax=Carya illinoinensis TaxID=32201 RepID=UPI001C723D3F|nr:uncharacterized protein LOC122296957 [Carya illinoinensis]
MFFKVDWIIGYLIVLIIIAGLYILVQGTYSHLHTLLSSSPKMSSSSSSTSMSSSFAKHTSSQALCFCEVKPTLKYSTTAKNPGRAFLGCPNYNTEGLPFCKYFKWADSNQVIELQIRERIDELLRKERDLEKIVKLLEKREIDLRKIVDQLETELVRHAQRSQRKCLVSRFLGMYWAAALVLCFLFGRWLLF